MEVRTITQALGMGWIKWVECIKCKPNIKIRENINQVKIK